MKNKSIFHLALKTINKIRKISPFFYIPFMTYFTIISKTFLLLFQHYLAMSIPFHHDPIIIGIRTLDWKNLIGLSCFDGCLQTWWDAIPLPSFPRLELTIEAWFQFQFRFRHCFHSLCCDHLKDEKSNLMIPIPINEQVKTSSEFSLIANPWNYDHRKQHFRRLNLLLFVPKVLQQFSSCKFDIEPNHQAEKHVKHVNQMSFTTIQSNRQTWCKLKSFFLPSLIRVS